MSLASIFFAQTETTFYEPSYFAPAMMAMLALGTVVSLVACVLGFARARAFGPPARWFSFLCVCLLLFHIQFLVMGFGALTRDSNLVFSMLIFFNFFIMIAAICAIIGFVRMTSTR